jgi:D-alanyl-D-alanine carboxypeptidase
MGGRTAVRRDLEMMHLMDTEFAAISVNPSLVARGPIPWHETMVASVTAPSTGFAAVTASPNTTQFSSLSAVPPPPLPADTDEDSAESHRAPDENFATLKVEAPALASAATPPEPVPAPASDGVSQPMVAAAEIPGGQQIVPPKPTQSAMPTPAMAGIRNRPAKPQQMASAGPVATVIHAEEPGRTWTIQIGAFGNEALAEAQLKKYAARATDVVGQATHIIAPIHSASGHMIYRARFGPYGEREAREVCSELTERGQSCFPVVAR